MHFLGSTDTEVIEVIGGGKVTERGNSHYEGWTQPFTVTKAQNKGTLKLRSYAYSRKMYSNNVLKICTISGVIGHLNKISNKISNVGSKPVKNSASMLFNPFEFLSKFFTL